ncbi:hypothetical protein GHK86_08420 [Acidimicrobiaceae bacterium USS-CC1]|uniref:Hemerythrin-like domain-containing protein n=1 Tax=Acidiferrimicrobium australe TaxID=2664430 RepID=A0ABW9QSD1_9ACTN|nr:hypothetical protein [Acidiferrimicrobium australe]
MPDICDLILDEHEHQRRRFAELDEVRDAAADVLARRWEPLATLLERHAAAEEAIFYPALLQVGVAAEEETEDAISDHNDIRDAVRRANGVEPGSEEWWQAVRAAREANSDHMGEEERGALADLRAHDDAEGRRALGDRWTAWSAAHADGSGVPDHDRDPDAYIRGHA